MGQIPYSKNRVHRKINIFIFMCTYGLYAYICILCGSICTLGAQSVLPSILRQCLSDRPRSHCAASLAGHMDTLLLSSPRIIVRLPQRPNIYC